MFSTEQEANQSHVQATPPKTNMEPENDGFK